MVIKNMLFSFKILDGSNCIFDDVDYCQYGTQGLEAYDYLVRHSGRKLNEFCLSYIFTKNDFQDGSLGLAWTASSQRGKLSTPSIKVNNDGPVKCKNLVTNPWNMSCTFSYS